MLPYYELKDRGIIGMKAGRTRKFKISTWAFLGTGEVMLPKASLR